MPTSDTAQVKLSSSGQLTIYNASGAAGTIDLVVDVQGYFTAVGSGTGAVFTPASGLVYSTRTTGNTAVAGNSSRAISVAGTAGIPAMGSGITAVAIRVEARHAANSTGDATVWADGSTKPGTTSVNFTGDSIRDNTAIVALGSNGGLDVYNRSADSTDFLIYLEGWYVNPQARTIRCPSPYTNNSWGQAVPSADITCTVSSPIATGTGQESAIIGDDGTEKFIPENGTRTDTSMTIAATAGEHTLTATSDPGQGAVETDYRFTLGDWTQNTILTSPSDGEVTSLDPTFTAGPDDSNYLPDNATASYSVWSSADVTQPPMIVSGPEADAWQAPANTFKDGSTYWLQTTVTGATGYRGQAGSVTLPVTSFTVSSAVLNEDPLGDDGTTSVQPQDSTQYDYSVTSYQVVNKSHVSRSFIYKAHAGVIADCIAASANTSCSISKNGTVSTTVNVALGDSVASVSGSLGITSTSSVTITQECRTVTLAKGEVLYALAVGDYYTYKIKRSVQDRFHYYPATVTTSGTLTAFRAHPKSISCDITKGAIYGTK